MATATIAPTEEQFDLTANLALLPTAFSPAPVKAIPLNWEMEARQLKYQQDQQQSHQQSYVKPVEANRRLDLMLEMRQDLTNEEQPLSVAQLQLATHLAEHLCDWFLLLQLIDKQLEIEKNNNFTLNFELRLQHALCQSNLGLYDSALTSLETLLLERPFETRLISTYHDIKAKWQALPFNIADLQTGPLMLVPLTEEHINDFRWQYADPSISELCNLPKFSSDDNWLDWLANCQQDKDRHLFGVIHIEWGFIGSVSLESFQGIGFFYYWLGSDFQKMGFGPQAVNVLLQLGEKYLGVDCCYAKVYAHNIPSQKAMAKLGFTDVNIKVQAPFDNEIFYYLGPDKGNWGIYQELQWLLGAMESELELARAEGYLYLGKKMNIC